MNTKFVLLVVATIAAVGHSATIRKRRQAGFASLQQPVTVEILEKPTETTPFEPEDTTQWNAERHLTTVQQKMESAAHHVAAQIDEEAQAARAKAQQKKEQLAADKAQQEEAEAQTTTEKPQTEETTKIIEKKIETTQSDEEQKNDQATSTAPALSTSEFPTTYEEAQEMTEQPREESSIHTEEPKEELTTVAFQQESTPEFKQEEEPVQTTSERPQEESTPFEQQETHGAIEQPRQKSTINIGVTEQPKEEHREESTTFKSQFQTTQQPATAKIIQAVTRTTFYPLVDVQTNAPSTRFPTDHSALPIRRIQVQQPDQKPSSLSIQKT